MSALALQDREMVRRYFVDEVLDLYESNDIKPPSDERVLEAAERMRLRMKRENPKEYAKIATALKVQ